MDDMKKGLRKIRRGMEGKMVVGFYSPQVFTLGDYITAQNIHFEVKIH